MAYNPVPTVNAGDRWTASDVNTYIRDNFAAGAPDIFTTKGDLAVASGADAAGRLAVGSNGKILIADSAQALGMRWGYTALESVVTTKGDLVAGISAGAFGKIAASSYERRLSASSNASTGVTYAWKGIDAVVNSGVSVPSNPSSATDLGGGSGDIDGNSADSTAMAVGYVQFDNAAWVAGEYIDITVSWKSGYTSAIMWRAEVSGTYSATVYICDIYHIPSLSSFSIFATHNRSGGNIVTSSGYMGVTALCLTYG